jgi:hypothetical protein
MKQGLKRLLKAKSALYNDITSKISAEINPPVNIYTPEKLASMPGVDALVGYNVGHPNYNHALAVHTAKYGDPRYAHLLFPMQEEAISYSEKKVAPNESWAADVLGFNKVNQINRS